MDKGRLTAIIILLAVIAGAAAGAVIYFNTNPEYQSPGSSAQDTQMPEFLTEVYPSGLAYRGGVFTWQRVEEERGGRKILYWRGVSHERSVTIIVRPGYEGPSEVQRETQTVEHMITVPWDDFSVYVRADLEATADIEATLAPLYEKAKAKGVTVPDFEARTAGESDSAEES